MILPAGDAPRVTVIIATYNGARMLRCALRSALRQELADIEVLVAGDCCTDDSEQVVADAGDARVRWLNRSTNCGSQSGPNNDALALARAPYVAFLGHDDLWFPWHLSALVSELDAGCAFAHSISAHMAPDGVQGFATPMTAVPPSSWLIRRSLLEALGGFRDHSTLSRATDTDLMYRAVKAGHRIVCVPRLSVLKFPSHWWGAYAKEAMVPQEEWVAAISSDAPGVERDLLTQGVLKLSFDAGETGLLRAVGLELRGWMRRLRHKLEGDRGLVHALFRWRFAQQRRLLKRRRGL
jgi:glycosyltransferase involved in cell wall biosynthesis